MQVGYGLIRANRCIAIASSPFTLSGRFRSIYLLKILYISTLYSPNLVGGAERVAQSIAEDMAAAGHETVVLSTTPQKSSVDWINGVKVYYINLKNIYWPYGEKAHAALSKALWHAFDIYNPWMAREVVRILCMERPDLVHSHLVTGFSCSIWRATKQLGLPLVHTLHDYYLLCPRSTMFRDECNCRTQCVQCQLYARPKRKPTNLVDTVVGVSNAILRRHLEFGYFDTTAQKAVIYNASPPLASATLRSDLPSVPIQFGFLGRLDPTKGLEVLLEAVGRLPRGSWRLKVGGRGTAGYENYLRAKYKMPEVDFAGHVNPDSFLPEIDVLVVPSVWQEPAGRVVNEAYAHGIAVVGARIGGIPELIEEGGTGLLFAPGDSGDLARWMDTLIERPTMVAEMRRNCLKKAERLSPEAMAEQHQKIYAEIMAKL
jgi:glycosyltransferase involved in cell wall biosynthesis